MYRGFLVSLLGACTPPAVTCGPGTHLAGDVCISDDTDADTADADVDTDADTDTDTDTDADADADTAGPGAPVAVCTAETSPVDVGQTLHFDGSASYDPNGHPITSWSWQLIERPTGSAATLDDAGVSTPVLIADAEGQYDAVLSVTTDDGGVSTPCEVVASAAWIHQIVVQLYWTQPGDDLDLHLLRGDVSAIGTVDDCGQGNAHPEWGAPGTLDDPRLDLDDIPGTGPEDITMDEPAEGTYTIVVHDHASHVFEDGNDATVNVFVGGANVFTSTLTILGEDSWTTFGTVEVNSGVVTVTP